MIERGTEPCRRHRGEPAHNCGCCRSEQIADPAAEPARQPAVTVRKHRRLDVKARKEAT